jgi:glycosyltransferase involved in cell wall biosynthesis
MICVISFRALGEPFRARVRSVLGEEVYFFEAGKLRTLGVRRAWQEIAALKGRNAVVAIENEESRPLAGPLTLVAAIAGFRRVSALWPDGSVERVSFARLARLPFRVVWDQVVSRVRYVLARRDTRNRVSGDGKLAALPAEKGPVLYLDANLSFGVAAGGSVGHIKGVIDALCRSGREVDYASVRKIPTSAPGTQWLRLDAPTLYAFPSELNYYAFASRYEVQVERWARLRSYQFLYQRMSLHNYSGARLRDRLGLPLVLEYNGSEAWAAANWGERLALHDMAVATEDVSLRSADLVVTVSDVLADEVASKGVARERIVVYPNCIDPAIFDPSRFSESDTLTLRRRHAIPDDAVLATFIGTFGTWHGVDFLARAVRRLVDEDRDFLIKHRLHFLLVGDGLRMSEVRATLDPEPYRKFVTLTGLVPQNEAPAYLAASDIFLSPHMPNPDGTAFFGSPTKLFEYMAMGRPIIAADLDQIGGVLTDNFSVDNPDHNGSPMAELYVPGDEAAFLKAIANVLLHPSVAEMRARRARQAAREKYTWDRHVDVVLERMNDLNIIK